MATHAVRIEKRVRDGDKGDQRPEHECGRMMADSAPSHCPNTGISGTPIANGLIGRQWKRPISNIRSAPLLIARDFRLSPNILQKQDILQKHEAFFDIPGACVTSTALFRVTIEARHATQEPNAAPRKDTP